MNKTTRAVQEICKHSLAWEKQYYICEETQFTVWVGYSIYIINLEIQDQAYWCWLFLIGNGSYSPTSWQHEDKNGAKLGCVSGEANDLHLLLESLAEGMGVALK